MIGVAIVNGCVAIVVAWLAYRQERVRRDLKAFNGSVNEQLQAIHQNLIDNPGPPSRPPNEYVRDGGTSEGDPTLTPNSGGA